MQDDERYVKGAVNRDRRPPNPIDEIADSRDESFRDSAEHRRDHERFEFGLLVSLGQTKEQERKTNREKPDAAGNVRRFPTVEEPRRNPDERDENAAHRDGQTREPIPSKRTEHEKEHAERPHEKQRSRKKNHQRVFQVHGRDEMPAKVCCNCCKQKPGNNREFIIVLAFDASNGRDDSTHKSDCEQGVGDPEKGCLIHARIMQAVGITWKVSAVWAGSVRVSCRAPAWVWGALLVGEARGYRSGRWDIRRF